MATLTVGAGDQYSTLASAVAAAHNGDVIEVQAGTYTNDFATITKNITIEGVGGMVNLVATEAPPNGKAILVTDANVTLDNISFSGASVPDGNGAGIRYETGNLTINNCYFHDNQDGLLAASDPSGSITINNSEFSHNGTGDGYTHNLYVGEVGTLTIDNSYFHDAVVGHEIKSRADTTIIENSRIIDGPNGTASYSIDLPNGGHAVISNDVIEQGPNSQNPIIISYGEETSTPYANSALQITNDTIINDLHSSSALGVRNTTDVTASLSGDKIYGLSANQVVSGPATQTGVTMLATEPTLDLTSHFVGGSSSTPTSAPPPTSTSSSGSSSAPSSSAGEGSVTSPPSTLGSTASGTSSPPSSSPHPTAPSWSDGSGHDVFAFTSLAQKGGDIAHFHPGQDILDLAPLLHSLGYQGQNPIADHLVSLNQSGGNTVVTVNPTGHDSSHGTSLITLEHVMPHELHAANFWH